MSDAQIERMKWIKGSLVASLAFNLFLGGFLFSRALSDRETGGTPEIVDVSWGTLPANIPVEVSEELEDQLRRFRRPINRAYGRLIETRQELNRLMASEQFDRAAVETAMERLRIQQLELQSPVHAAILEALASLEPVDRQGVFVVRDADGNRRLFSPGKVDGNRWQFEWRNGGVEFDLDEEETPPTEEDAEDS